MFNANRNMSFYDIVHFLNRRFNKNWNITVGEPYSRDQRMIDDRTILPGTTLLIK